MYDRSDTMWLYEYYSGVPRKVIAERLFRSEGAVTSRVSSSGLPMRPHGGGAPRLNEWLRRPEIKALRDKYMPSPPLVPR